MEQIAAAGNIEVPAYLALRQAGFDDENEQWVAAKSDIKLIAESPLELLGLWLRKERGANWKATGEEIEAFLRLFYPQS
jgi:hypothetical protein